MSPGRSPGERKLRLAPALESSQAARRREAPASDSRWEATIASRHGRRDYAVRRMLAGVDMLAITGAVALTFLVSSEHTLIALVWLFPVLPLWVALFGLYGLYGRDLKRIGPSVLDDLPSVFHALLLGGIGLWAYFRILPPDKLVFEELLVFGIAAVVLVLALRWLARQFARRIFGAERILLVGQSAVTPALIRKMRTHSEYGLQPIGLVCVGGESGNGVAELAPPLPVLGNLADGDIGQLIDLHHVERVVVSEEEVDDDLLLDLFRKCGRLQVKVSVLPRGVETMGPSMEIDDIEGVTILGLNPLVLSRSSRALKRSMDVLGATVALALASPVMILAALAIKLSSRGPVLFRHSRVGREGETFSLYKFRTMVEDADSRTPELMASSQDPHWLKLEDDPRITAVGRVLRPLSIDELPQLWNVLKGDMSLVGPRPVTPWHHEQIEGWARIRLDLAPGITGLWQVLGRASIPFEEMIKLDYLYVTNWSLWLDIRLLLRTVPAVLRGRGAN